MHSPDTRPVDATSALRELKAGNDRWQRLTPAHPRQGEDVRREVVAAQHPFATVVSCIDSRVPSELVFDQGLGDLLTVRTAGQMVDDAVLASVQFGALQLRTPLVVVLGHSGCGAVGAAADVVDGGAPPPGRLARLVEWVRPMLDESGGGEGVDRVEAAITANVRRVVGLLRTEELLAPLVDSGELHVVGARYELATGQVAFLA